MATRQAAVVYRPSVAVSIPIRGAITAGANSVQATSICSAVIAASAGSSGGDFTSADDGDSIRRTQGEKDGGRHFGSYGRCIARKARAPHAGGDLFACGRAARDRKRQARR